VKHPSKRPTTRIRKKEGRIEIASQTVREEIRMATITQEAGGFIVTDASRITANMTLFSPVMPTDRTVNYDVLVPKDAAAPPTGTILSTLTRVLPGGATQYYSIVLSALVNNEVFLPSGIFPGRRVGYTVKDEANPKGGTDRKLSMKIMSLDGSGANESWRQLFIVALPAGKSTGFTLKFPAGLTAGEMTFDSVDVNP
jgi:hypothetical protein